jgi:hypothetical protein
LKKTLKYLFYFIIIVFALEFTLRILGNSVYTDIKSVSNSRVENRYLLVDSLGIDLVPGCFSFLDGRTKKTLTHKKGSYRLTFKEDTISLPKIILLGCSYTYGYGLSDRETYPYIADSLLTDFNVLNYAVPGHGTLQALIRLKKILLSKNCAKPKFVITNYLSFHDERNCLDKNYETKLLRGFEIREKRNLSDTLLQKKMPYLIANNGLPKIHYLSIQEMKANEFPLKRYSALANRLSNLIINRTINLEEESELSCYLLGEINALCLENDIKFFVSYMESEKQVFKILNYCDVNNIQTIDLSIDLSDTTNFNSPFDPFHPNYKANKIFANKLITSLAKKNIK